MRNEVHRLFCYGTLMFPEVMMRVAGPVGSMREAGLAGFGVYRLGGLPYPGLVARPGAMAQGVLYEGLTMAQLRRLDSYEGELYRRRRVMVEGSAAWTYVVAPRYRHRLTAKGWNASQFAQQDLGAYLARLGVRRLGRRPQRYHLHSPITA